MRHVGITDAKSQLDDLLAEVESTGDDVIITRDGVAVARLIREGSPERHELPPAAIERRREVIDRIRRRAATINLGATQQEIKQWINEGRH
ncbi:prevent-host-death family protein [Rhodopseudomonas rhenobacensis]|uniref:Antitoxin n=1 Tax=Rhodopseudomonas rhenobacensis TaxID=87461 RepID=A0A7W8DZE3_9BRAD|nr:type II toxin-antitoxin system Phd/YefM family antitoxin [Rhodopseudomonas rhenobacensis]MBB5047780.1 prevent-host-death family protein [Rhodopseudomonas rhenobacensis]